MEKTDNKSSQAENVRSYLWLGLGIVSAIFSNGNQAIPMAAWAFPVLILRFLRGNSSFRGFLLAFFSIIVATTVAIWPMLSIDPLPPQLRIAAGVIWGLRYFLPFLADCLIGRRLRGLAGTLIFPLAWVTFEYLYSLTPDGTWGALAYTQYGDLPLMQLVSVTGIWGIAFLMTWFASVINWAWERGWAKEEVRFALGFFVGVTGLVLIFGGARLALFPANSKTVRVAAITKPEPFALFFDVRGRRESVCRHSKEEQQYFLEQSRRAAQDGAKIIAWQEHAVFIPAEDEAVFIERSKELAREAHVYLLMAYNTYPPDFPRQPWTNKLTAIDRFGIVAWEYYKSYPSTALEPGLRPGKRLLPILQTSFGKIGAIICTDQEHPGLVRQTGQSGAFLLLVPSGGWKGVTPLHTYMAAFRAIENGCALVKPDGRGLSAAFDHQGRVLSTLNYYRTADQNIMLSDIPTDVVRTFYATIGDGFAWLCLLSLATICVYPLFRRKSFSAQEDWQTISLYLDF